MSGGKDGQTLFHRIPPSRGVTSTTAVDWHLRVKNKKCDVGLKKIIASQSACKKSAQSINLFRRF